MRVMLNYANGQKKIVCDATGVSYQEAESVLTQTDYKVKPAIIMLLMETTYEEAERLLAQSEGHVRTAMELKNRK